MKLSSIELIEKVKVHWSESSLINEVLGQDQHGDIEKEVTPEMLDELIGRASKLVGIGYDKTSLTVYLKDGTKWADEVKFYLTKSKPNLLSLIEF